MKVRIKESFCKGELNFTLGKEYEVIGEIADDGCRGFDVFDDDGDKCYCLLGHCSHLNGGSWEIVP